MLINAANYSYTLGGQEVVTWPERTAIEIFSQRPALGLVRFTDGAAYHPRLIEYALAQEAGGARRIDGLQDWAIPEAELINTRALKLCADLAHSDTLRVIAAYALIVRSGVSLLSDSELQALASVVYLLDAGDADPANGSSGRLSFTHRKLAGHSADQPPRMAPGVMIAYPADMQLAALPYTGQRPRILLNWQIADAG